MKRLINRFTTTVKVLQLLSDPNVAENLYAELKTKQTKQAGKNTMSRLGIRDAFYHKHFIVQVVN